MRRVRQKWFGSLCLALIALSLVGCAPSPAAQQTTAAAGSTVAAPPNSGALVAPSLAPSPNVPGPQASGALTTVRVGYLNSASDAGILIGLAKGYFRAQMLDVQLQRFESGATMTPPLASGQLDVGGGSPSAGLYNAIARNITIKIVADKGSDRPGFGYQGIAVRKGLERQVTDYKDLKGLKVGMASLGGTSAEIVLNRALQAGGLTMKDVEIVPVQYPDLNTALRTGAIDVAIHFEPLFSMAVAQGLAVSWKRGDEVYPNHQSSTILYGTTLVQSNPDAARRWMVAYLQGVRYYNDAFVRNRNKDEVVDIIAQATGSSAQVIAGSVPAGLNPDGYVNVRGLEDDAQTLRELGYVQQPVDMSAIVDNTYADAAVQQLGPY